VYQKDLDFGAFFAKAKELVLTSFYKHAMSEEQALAVGIAYLEEDFATTYRLAGVDEPVKNPTKAVEMLRRYFTECPLEEGDIVPFQLLDYDISVEKSLLMELPLKHPETGLPLYLSAKPDMFGIERSSDTLVVVDEKTSGYSVFTSNESAEVAMLKYKLGNQAVQYATVINANPELVYGRKCTHGEVRIVLTSQKAAGARGSTIPKNKPYIEKLHFVLTDFHQKEWLDSTLALISELIDSYNQLKSGVKKPFRKSFGHCISKDVEKYSFRPCEFWQHCTEASYANIPERYGMQQLVYDKEKDVKIPLTEVIETIGAI
jgi:hypothetical protein